MCLEIEDAIDSWRNDDAVKLIMIDGAGDRAFCSGGDIVDMYASGQNSDLDYGRKFWRDEYRLNSKLAHYPKPIVTFLHGFTMGGGVGVGCHASHRIVCENSQIAMPECTIGLVPDVGGTYLLARAPGFIGTYLGLTGTRMDAGDAIFAGFADQFIPHTHWDDVKSALVRTGKTDALPVFSAPTAALSDKQADIDVAFAADNLSDILSGPLDADMHKTLDRNSPLAMACSVILINRARQTSTINDALAQEYRFTHRAVEHSDFIEGIRAAIIDKDRKPRWQALTDAAVTNMIAPLGPNAFDMTGDAP
ncbi:MAG: enoyl-CoA hydratase [Yoonia sp.]|jgi:enoyl-CoA hydratase